MTFYKCHATYFSLTLSLSRKKLMSIIDDDDRKNALNKQ